MNIYITLLENVNKSRTSAGNVSLSKGNMGALFVLFETISKPPLTVLPVCPSTNAESV
jgi:hypothetical protein